MKTQNLAVMFTDIQGFTSRTSQQTREENAAFLRLHDALLLPVVRAFGGRKVKTIGDALLVVFASPTNSVGGFLRREPDARYSATAPTGGLQAITIRAPLTSWWAWAM